MIVVADTSPINYLVQLGQVEVLNFLFGRVLLPEGVVAELLDPGAPTLVWQWAQRLPMWVDVGAVSAPAMDDVRRLDPGEREAIQLALECHAGLILIDDGAGRRVAKQCGLAVTGTLRVLSAAADDGYVDFEGELERLLGLGFRASEKVIQRARLRLP